MATGARESAQPLKQIGSNKEEIDSGNRLVHRPRDSARQKPPEEHTIQAVVITSRVQSRAPTTIRTFVIGNETREHCLTELGP
jgi:hypothetical protein